MGFLTNTKSNSTSAVKKKTDVIKPTDRASNIYGDTPEQGQRRKRSDRGSVGSFGAGSTEDKEKDGKDAKKEKMPFSNPYTSNIA